MSPGQSEGVSCVATSHTHWLPQAEGKKTVPLEVQKDIIHNKRGILSMGRHSDPNSGGSSFSILLGPAPHLDQEYTIFGCAPKHLAIVGGRAHIRVRSKASLHCRWQGCC